MSDYIEKKLNSFDPNSKKREPWSTYVPSRSVEFRTHSSRATALNCISAAQSGLLFEWDGAVNRWELRARKYKADHKHTCNQCQKTTLTTARHYYGAAPIVINGVDHWDNGHFIWRKVHGKVVSPPELLYLCAVCYNWLR